jgi:MFS family permease
MSAQTSSSDKKWWVWLLAAAATSVVAIVAGPVADRHGYGTATTLAVCIFAWAVCSVCLVLAVVRFLKWAWSFVPGQRLPKK